MDQTERITALKRVPIFAELPQARLEQLAGMCKWQCEIDCCKRPDYCADMEAS